MAMIYLGQLYEKGAPSLRRNFGKAHEYYHRAAEHEIPEGYEELARCYRCGIGVTKDLIVAKALSLMAETLK